MDNTLLKLTDISFPIAIIEHQKNHPDPIFQGHLHENHLQLFYFTKGNAIIYCNKKPYTITSPQIFLVNNSQLHYGENNSNNLHYYVFRIDLKLSASYNISIFNEKYLTPLINNLVVFENLIDDSSIAHLLSEMIKEYNEKTEGYELRIFSDTLYLLSILFKDHIKVAFSHRNSEILSKKQKRFSKVFEYIENNYNKSISLKDLSDISFMSQGYFCRIFKQTTGRTPMDYINKVRIEKSVILLNQGICNVTEAAMSVGFDDINYFCRVFKKYMKQSPSSYIHNDRRYFL